MFLEVFAIPRLSRRSQRRSGGYTFLEHSSRCPCDPGFAGDKRVRGRVGEKRDRSHGMCRVRAQDTCAECVKSFRVERLPHAMHAGTPSLSLAKEACPRECRGTASRMWHWHIRLPEPAPAREKSSGAVRSRPAARKGDEKATENYHRRGRFEVILLNAFCLRAVVFARAAVRAHFLALRTRNTKNVPGQLEAMHGE